VDGSLILIGQNAGIDGTVTGGVYAVALTLDLASRAALGRDLYVATVSLTSANNSTVGRDLYAVGLDSGLNGRVGRNLHTTIGPIQLYNGLMTVLGFDDLTIKLHFDLPKPADDSGTGLVQPGQHARFRAVDLAGKKPFDWDKWGLNLLRSWLVLFLFSLLAVWLARKLLQHTREPLHTHAWKTLGIGFVVLVASLAMLGAGLLLAVLLFAFGLGLNYLGVWQISIAVWAAGYALLALALAVLWFMITYGTKIVLIYILSTWAFGKLFHRLAFWMDLLAILAGTILYSLLRCLPYFGWIFDILATVAGAGAAWLAIQAFRSPSTPVLPVEVKPSRTAKRPVRKALKK
jgi:hypothetical protein